jgi:hypothetical protein
MTLNGKRYAGRRHHMPTTRDGRHVTSQTHRCLTWRRTAATSWRGNPSFTAWCRAPTIPELGLTLLEVDKVDLVVGDYGTNLLAPAMPVIISHNVRGAAPKTVTPR